MKAAKLILVFVVLLLRVVSIQGQDIFDAIKNNDVARVQALLEKDTSLVNQKDTEGNTPLHKAGIVGSVSIAEFILSKGAEINAVNNFCITR